MEDVKNSDTVRIGPLTLKFLVDETTGPGNMVMFEFEVPPKARVPARHFHRDVDEAIYGLAGTMTSTIDGSAREITPGTSAFVPRGAVHIHENLHDNTAKVLIVMSPGTIGRRYFEEMAAEINVPAKPDMAKIQSIMQRHGLIPA
jgi:quercetin dioxygenase-like cupin family protein